MSCVITSLNACAPFALAQLFKESYKSWCRRIHAQGGDYRAVSSDVLHRTLLRRGVAETHTYARPRHFSRWRQTKSGRWVVVVTGVGSSSSSHCIVLRDGRAYDNGWALDWGGDGRIRSLRVHMAWRMQD